VNGEENGTWGLFYFSGQLIQEEEWEEGKLMDVGPYYSIEGDTLPKGSFKDGNGIKLAYYISGKLANQVTYKEGVPHGTWTEFHEDGSVSAKGEMKEGQRNGLWIFYYPNGKTESEGNYENGEQIGKWKFYNRWGSLNEVVDFDREKNI
jgi:uncharacterized protein